MSGVVSLAILATAILLAVAVRVRAAQWAYYIFGPAIDNLLGVLTRRDLHLFKGVLLDGRSLGSVIQERAGTCWWTARHDEVIFATEIECNASSGVFRWELSHSPPRSWLPAQALYVTPLNRVAAELVPEILPPGIDPKSVPQSGFGSGFLYDLAKQGGNPEFGEVILRSRMSSRNSGGPTMG
jgi:hypothetical protein